MFKILFKITFLLLIITGCKKEIGSEYIKIRQTYEFQININHNIDTAYTPGEEVKIEGSIFSIEKNSPIMQVEWKSNKDGLLKVEKTDNKSACTLITSTLSKNIHMIYVTLINSNGFYNEDSIRIFNILPKPVNLLSITKDNNTAKLIWTSSSDSSFSCYEIYRNDRGLIATLNNIQQNSYTDSSLNLNQTYSYQVIVKNKTLITSKPSNTITIVAGNYYEYGSIFKMIKDPNKNYVYAMSSNGILFINTNTMAMEKSITEISSVDIDIDKTGSYLYATEGYKKSISKIDLNTKLLVSSFSTTYISEKILCRKENRIYYKGGPSDNNGPLVALNLSGNFINEYDTYGGPFAGNMVMYPSGQYLYFGESDLSSCQLIKFDISNDGFNSVAEATGYYPEAFIRISSDGSRLFWSRKLLDQNLNILVDPIDKIYDFSSFNNYAICGQNIIDINTYYVIKKIPASFDDAIFISTNEILIYIVMESSVIGENKYRLFKYKYQ